MADGSAAAASSPSRSPPPPLPGLLGSLPLLYLPRSPTQWKVFIVSIALTKAFSDSSPLESGSKMSK